MKKIFIPILMILMALTLISCSIDAERMEDGDVNYNIYPYLKFTYDSSNDYYTASVMEGAKLEHVSIPGFIHSEDGKKPVKVFAGFENPMDSENLKVVFIDTNIDEVSSDAFEYAKSLEKVVTTGINEGQEWAKLPARIISKGYHFHGWKIGDELYEGGSTFPFDPDLPDAIPYFIELEHHDAQEPSCTEKGNKEYWECQDCGEIFTDNKATNRINPSDTIVEALGHKYSDLWLSDEDSHYHLCARCNEKGNVGGHVWSEPVITLPPTESTNGIKTYVCVVCLYEKTEEIPMSGCSHSLVHHDEVAADCTTGGNIEYYECSKCGLYFTDIEGKNPVSVVETEALGHDYDAEAWGAYDDQYHYHVCKRKGCGALDEESKESHSIIHSPTSDGGAHYAQCPQCGYENTEETMPHLYGEWIVDVAPIGEYVGRHHRVCSICSHSESEDYRLGFLDISIDSTYSTQEGLSVHVMRIVNTKNEYQTLITAPSEMTLTAIEWQLDDSSFGEGGLTERFVIPGVGDHKVSFEALINGSYGYAEIIFTIKEN